MYIYIYIYIYIFDFITKMLSRIAVFQNVNNGKYVFTK